MAALPALPVVLYAEGTMSADIEHYMTVIDAAKVLGVSVLYARILAAKGLLPAKAVGERSSGKWTGNNTTRYRAAIWLVDPRPESRDWRTYQEAADALGIERSQVRSLVHKGSLNAIETGDPRLKVITLRSLQEHQDRAGPHDGSPTPQVDPGPAPAE